MLKKLSELFAPTQLSVVRLTGRARFAAAELSAVYLGNERNLSFLRDLFFESVTASNLLHRAVPRQLRALLAATQSDADLVLCELPPLWTPFLPKAATLRFPAWIRQEIHLPDAATDFLPGALQKEVDRHVRRQGYVIDFTNDAQAKRLFFQNQYRPYINSRFGAGAIVDQEGAFMKRCRGQTLARLYAGGTWVAGLLVTRQGRSLRLNRFGAASCPPPRGASEVLDALVIRHAHASGVRRVVMGDSRPSLADGALRYKARFGASIVATAFPQPTLCIEVRRWSEAVQACLTNQPLIAVKHGRPFAYRVSDKGTTPTVSLEAL